MNAISPRSKSDAADAKQNLITVVGQLDPPLQLHSRREVSHSSNLGFFKAPIAPSCLFALQNRREKARVMRLLHNYA